MAVANSAKIDINNDMEKIALVQFMDRTGVSVKDDGDLTKCLASFACGLQDVRLKIQHLACSTFSI